MSVVSFPRSLLSLSRSSAEGLFCDVFGVSMSFRHLFFFRKDGRKVKKYVKIFLFLELLPNFVV